MSTKQKIDQMIREGFMFIYGHPANGDVEIRITKKLQWTTIGDMGIITEQDFLDLHNGEAVQSIENVLDSIKEREQFEINYWKNKKIKK